VAGPAIAMSDEQMMHEWIQFVRRLFKRTRRRKKITLLL
jgi:U3 small nucleolar ribonucleoprotein component